MGTFTLPENLKIITAHEPAIISNIVATSDIISCKNLKKLWVVASYAYGDNVNAVVTWHEGTDIAFTTSAAITEVCPIWSNIDTATADLPARQTDAITFTIDAGAGKNQKWIMEWDPAKFSDGYDCFKIVFAGSACTGLCSVDYYGLPRYQSDVNVTALTD